VSSTAERLLERSTGNTSGTKVMSELAGQFQRLEELCSRHEGPSVRICDQLLGSSPGQACWANRLEEAAGRPEAMTAKQH
jgi:hypothetical protein